jgi:hypothetical protein
MRQLNQNTYHLLQKANEQALEYLSAYEGPDWYKLTYEIFTNAPLDTLTDFWKIVAYTYSWMPTIPDVKAHLIKEPDALLLKLQALKAGDRSQLSDLLHQLIPVINNSLVGTSKVLHFIAPGIVPIIDRNVLRGWDIFFFKLHTGFNVIRLPNYQVGLNRNHIEKYLSYKKLLSEWVENGEHTFSMRDLEFSFFELGRNTIKEQPELPVYKP